MFSSNVAHPECLYSSATQVGHQLALIGDEFNRMYHRKFEDTLLQLARG